MVGVYMLTVTLIAGQIGQSLGHSWVACTDYRGDVNVFEQGKCHGWPRGYRPVARDDGYQIAVPDARAYSHGGCDVSMTAGDWTSGYSPEFPHAIYEPGKVYCLAWPMKNHGWLPESCKNSHSKSDAGVNDTLHLYVSSLDPALDPSQMEFETRNINELAGLARNCNPRTEDSRASLDECQLGLEKHEDFKADCKGFLRAPRFCASSGMSMGTGCFKIPSTMAAGHYVGQWWWQTSFRRQTALQKQAYMSCFDFRVVENGSNQARQGITGTTGTPESDLPCTNNVYKFRPEAGQESSPTAVPTDVPGTPVVIPAPTPPSSGDECAGPHQVCASPGQNATCCVSGYSCAYHQDSGHARCLPAANVPSVPSTTGTSPQPTLPASTGIACKRAHDVCAEPGWGPDCCISGHSCQYYKDSGYARCLPDVRLQEVHQHHKTLQASVLVNERRPEKKRRFLAKENTLMQRMVALRARQRNEL